MKEISAEVRDALTLLTIGQVCDLLQVKRDWLYDECNAGRFPSLKIARQFRFRPLDVQAYLTGEWQPPA